METNGLINLCKAYNEEHPELIIDLDKYTKRDELIFCLWEREVDVGDLGFGQPYDELLKGYSLEYDHDDPDLETRIYGLETHSVYQSYLHPEIVSTFLCNVLNLPLVSSDSIATVTENLKKFRSTHSDYWHDDISKFNDFWCKLGKKPIKDYTELRRILISNKLTALDLCYLLWECDNYGMFEDEMSVWNVIEQIKKM